MRISRRNLLRHIGAAAAVGAAVRQSPVAGQLSPVGGHQSPVGSHQSPVGGRQSPVGSRQSEVSRELASADGRARHGPLRLDRNENAYGPSPKAIAAMQAASLSAANRYPDQEAEALRHQIARAHGVTPAQVVLGCGSGEILRMAAHAFAGSGKSVLLARPTFDLMVDCARDTGADIVAVPLRRDYAHDVSAMLARCDDRTALVYVCNPNNPTGTLTRRQDLDRLVRGVPKNAFVLIDEAYHHYAGASSEYASFIDRPADDPRVIVARSFSAIYGLAGLRVGYAIAAPETARRLVSAQLSANVSVVAAAAAAAALDDAAHVRLSAQRNADDRQEFFNQANARMVRCIDSQVNFVMLNTESRASEVVEHFRRNDILLPPPFAPMDGHIRVSLGLPDEMREFWRVWDLLPGGGHKMAM